MKLPRLTAPLFALTMTGALAACGGGGGGGVTPAPGSGGGPGPSTSSSPSPSPTGTPTAAPTATPTATPPPVGTNSAVTVHAEENFINGDRSWYTSGTASWANTAGGTATAPSGGSTDTMACSATQEPAASNSTFSQHAFVGIYYNGTWEAVPQAIGMVNPVAPTAGVPSHPRNTDAVENSQCEYNVHTHDYSGLVHIEDVGLSQSNTSMPVYATLQSLFDLWGAQLGATGITAGSSALTGAVQIYTGTPSGKDSAGNDIVTTYTPYTGAASALQFSKHMAVWLVIGTPPAAGLPQVEFVIVD